MNAPTPNPALHAVCRHSRGLTLVEILIALLVLSIGLLGLAGMQTLSLKFNTIAYQRTQATALAYDMADRMRANRQAALDGAYTSGFGEPQVCGLPSSDGSVADQDLAAWRNELACRLPQSTASIVDNGDDEFTLTVRWHEQDEDDPDPDHMIFEFTTAL